MSVWLDCILLLRAGTLIAAAFTRQLLANRSLLLGGGMLAVITALYPRSTNQLGRFVFGNAADALLLPSEVFGVVWWILGAWLVKSILAMVLRRTLFPNDNQPHARRLFDYREYTGGGTSHRNRLASHSDQDGLQ